MTAIPLKCRASFRSSARSGACHQFSPAEGRTRQRCAEKGPCRVQCLNLLPHQPSVSECHLIANRSNGLGACLMYNDPAGVLCLSLAFYSSTEKEGIGAEEHIKGQEQAGAEGPTLPPPVTRDGRYTCMTPTPLSKPCSSFAGSESVPFMI